MTRILWFVALGIIHKVQALARGQAGLCLTLAFSLAAFAGGQAALANGGEISLRDPSQVTKVRLVLDKSRTIRTGRSFKEALVANPAIADVVPLTNHTLYVVGKQIGMTRLTMLDEEKRMLGVVEIEVSYDIGALRKEIRRSVPGADIRIRPANGRLLLSGSVGDKMALARIIDITEQFTANCSDVRGEPAAGPKPKSGAKAATQGNQQVISLQVSAAPRQAPKKRRKCFSNAISVRAAQQVLLEVRFVEAQRDAGREFGLSWDAQTNRFTGQTGVIPSINSPLVRNFPSSNVAFPFGFFVTQLLNNGNSADMIIQALEQKGLARRLAEPNLVALSGDTANFLAGGEFPFPIQSDNNKITIEFKKFGVGLAFTPTVLGNGQINLKIQPEVSDLDPNNTLQVNQISIPSLVVRRASTTVELRDGQSFAIAGLLQTKHNKQLHQLPWVGQVPVLGALFRSSSYSKEESDLVIIVTPRLVKPVGPGNKKLITPLDGKVASNDRDFFLRGKGEVKKHWPAKYGHILDFGGGWATAAAKPTSKEPSGHASYK